MKHGFILGSLVLGLVACAPEAPMDDGTNATNPSTTATTDTMVTPDVVKLAVEDPIAVSIKNDRIDVDDDQPLPGATRFQVTNDSDQVRTLTIEGPGARASLEAPLQPFETRTMTIDVQVGTYRLISPASGGAGELTTEVQVTAPEGGT